MRIETVATVACAALAAFVGLLSHRISSAPGSSDQRPFRWVAFSAAAYGACDLVTPSLAAHGLVPWMSRVQTAAAMVHLWGWFRYSRAVLGAPPSPADRIASPALLGAAMAALVPGVLISARRVERAESAFGFAYLGALPTLAGVVVLVAAAAAAPLVLLRFARAWRAGRPYAGIHAVAFSALVPFAVNDALVGIGAVDGHYLLHVGFAAAVLAVAWVITGRFVESTRALDQLRTRLAADVEARSRDLATALGALHQAEKLAALGQFASGVAHEVNNPASVVTANLRYLEEACAARALPADAPEVIADALASMKRINDLVRKLVDAGRVAAAPLAPAVVRVSDVASSVAAQARARLPPAVSLLVDVPGDLFVRCPLESIAHVLDHLVANAAQAIPSGRGGRIEVRAERAGSRVRIAVADDGTGMSPEVLRHALEPFFTTRPAGRGAGLGLAVARGLVEAHGGALSLDSAPGVGTTATIELSAAEPPLPPALTPRTDR